MSKKNDSVAPDRDLPDSFLQICNDIGKLLNDEMEKRGLDRTEAAILLSQADGISFHNACQRLLKLDQKPANITLLTICCALDLFDQELDTRKKTAKSKTKGK